MSQKNLFSTTLSQKLDNIPLEEQARYIANELSRTKIKPADAVLLLRSIATLQIPANLIS